MQIICDYLLASSIATATATVMLNLWGVTGADEIHRFIKVPSEIIHSDKNIRHIKA